MPFAEAESRKDERSEGHRIDWGPLRSGSDESSVLKVQWKISIAK
jgi:hypothetical protein